MILYFQNNQTNNNIYNGQSRYYQHLSFFMRFLVSS